MAHVAYHTDHATFRCAGVEDDLSDRILSRPQRPGHGLVNHDDGLARPGVGRRDIAAGAQGDAHGRWIPVAHDPREREWRAATFVDDALRATAPRAIPAERQRVGDRGRFDSGYFL